MTYQNPKSQRILDTALQLFMAHGYRTISLDRIASVAGTTKMTVYRYFANKDILIEAVLLQRDKQFRQALEDYINPYPAGIAAIKAIFDWHELWFQEKNFRGCMFINAVSEFADENRRFVHIAQHHKKMIENLIEKNLLSDFSKQNAAQLAIKINFLLDGAIIATQMQSHPNAAKNAWSAAKKLLAKPHVG